MGAFRRIGLILLAIVAAGGLTTGCKSEVKIGAVISETGAVASYGSTVKKGLDMALEEVNAAGGWRGGNVVLVYKDDATMPDVGEQVVRELIEVEEIDYIIGAVASPVTLRIAPICEENGVVLLSPSSSAPGITDAGDYIFRNYPSDILEGTSMARFAKDEGFETVVILAVANEFGEGLTSVFTEEYESKFRDVSDVLTFHEDQTSGFDEIIAKTKELAPDGIYIIAYANALPGLLNEIRAGGITSVLMGTSSVPQDIGRAVGDAAEKLIYPRPGFDASSNDPAVAKFVANYRARYKEEPDIYAAHGYDALKLFMAALENAGSTHPQNVKLGMSAIKGFNGAAGNTTFDKNGDVVRYPRLFVIHEGESVPYERFAEQGGSLFKKS